jgi:hypothetical protein
MSHAEGLYDHGRLKALSKELQRPLQTLHVLGANNDPFCANTPFREKAAEWFAEIWNRFGLRGDVRLRRIHYLLVSQDPPVPKLDGEPYINTDVCWSFLCTSSRDARYLGLVPNLIDRGSDAPTIFLSPLLHRGAEINLACGGLLSGDEEIAAPALVLPQLQLDRPHIPQRYHLEIWCEKSTMNDILIPLGQRYGINMVIGVGEFSVTRCFELVERARQSQRPVRILYISDFDPAGTSMPVAVARKIEFELHRRDLKDELDIQLRPIVLTHDQCLEYRLPRTPLKESEHRAATFEARFGEGATELDALEALHPGELRRILLEEMHRYHDDTLDERIDEIATDAEELLESVTQEVMQRHAETLQEIEFEREIITAAIERAKARTQELFDKIDRRRGGPRRLQLARAGRRRRER